MGSPTRGTPSRPRARRLAACAGAVGAAMLGTTLVAAAPAPETRNRG